MSYLRDGGYRVPAAFSYVSSRVLLATLTSLFLCLVLGPFFIRKLYELKIGQSIRKEECPLLGKLHEKKENTPTMGGILILFSMLVSLLIWMDWSHVFTHFLLWTTLCLGGVGGVDDYLKLKYKNTKGLSGKKKLLAQALVALALALYFFSPLSAWLQEMTGIEPPVIKEFVAGEGSGTQLSLSEYASRIYFPFYKTSLLSVGIGATLVSVGLLFFVILGSSNAANLTDGLDGLAAGILMMVAICLGVFAFVSNHVEMARYLNILYIEGSGEIAVYLGAMVGACLGFLWYNGYPAQVFMGDTGSLALGGVVGVSAVLLRRELLLGLVGGVLVAEAVSVILQVWSFRYRGKKRIFLCTPLHHHFEYSGWPETKVVVRFWILGLLFAILGLVSLKLQ